MNRLALIVLLPSCLIATAVHAQNTIKDCDATIVKASYNKISQELVDWRMAEHVDQSTYSQTKTDVGASAVIYGVPVGADYAKFQENIGKLKRNNTQSYSRERFLNVLWTGIDPNSAEFYTNCLKTVGLALRKPLILIPTGATDSDITFRVIYTVSGRMPNPVKVEWQGVDTSNSKLPLEFFAGETGIVVHRPKTASTLVLNSPDIGNTEKIRLEPLPLPLSAEDKLLGECNITETEDPLPQFSRGGSTTWPCLPIRAGKYRATVAVTPTSPSGAPLRVNYALQLMSLAGKDPQSVNIPKAASGADGEIDVNAEAGISHTFASYGHVVSLPQGPVLFKLILTGAAHHCCFAQQSDAPIGIPRNVSLKLERLSD